MQMFVAVHLQKWQFWLAFWYTTLQNTSYKTLSVLLKILGIGVQKMLIHNSKNIISSVVHKQIFILFILFHNLILIRLLNWKWLKKLKKGGCELTNRAQTYMLKKVQNIYFIITGFAQIYTNFIAKLYYKNAIKNVCAYLSKTCYYRKYILDFFLHISFKSGL